MAFLSGPRQSGKSTLAHHLLKSEGTPKNYFNWDDDEFQKIWIKNKKQIPSLISSRGTESPLIVFDELHKFRHWKNSLKGFFDLFSHDLRILVTGSARLDLYRRSGDSLAGRYIPYRLHPFSFGEASDIKPPPKGDWPKSKNILGVSLDELLSLGPFPDPLFGGKERLAIRWWETYRERVVREDLRDLREVGNINLVSTMVKLLPDRVGSGLSYESIREDLRISFDTARAWIATFESLFLCFLIRPYSKNLKSTLRKEPKLYFYHWPAVRSEGHRLENLVACHLLKSCHAWTDSAIDSFELFYIRDKYKREVDFCVTRNDKIWLLLEVKSSAESPSKALEHYTDVLKPDFSIIAWKNGPDHKIHMTRGNQKIVGMNLERFLSVLN
jgi:predicted AAA+ superfamily ATPase